MISGRIFSSWLSRPTEVFMKPSASSRLSAIRTYATRLLRQQLGSTRPLAACAGTTDSGQHQRNERSERHETANARCEGHVRSPENEDMFAVGVHARFRRRRYCTPDHDSPLGLHRSAAGESYPSSAGLTPECSPTVIARREGPSRFPPAAARNLGARAGLSILGNRRHSGRAALRLGACWSSPARRLGII